MARVHVLAQSVIRDLEFAIHMTMNYPRAKYLASTLVVSGLSAFALILSSSPSAQANDWPHWRGPDRNGISAEADWDAKGKNVWKAEVGLGYSSVSVSQGRAFTLGHQEGDGAQGTDTVFAFDPSSGEVLWKHTFPAKIWNMAHQGGTLATPTCDGDIVYVTNREGRFFAFNAEDGDVLWEKDLVKEYEVKPPTWGFSASPLVTDELIYINVGPIIAFDKEGEEFWVSDDLGAAYSTPDPFLLDGNPCLAIFNGKGLSLLDSEEGTLMSGFEWKTKYDVNAATPVAIGDGERFFISSGYNRGCAMVQRSEGKLASAWESRTMRNHMAGCVLYQDHLYGFDDGSFKCIDLDGKEKWKERSTGKGAHIIAGDRIILLSGDGDLIIAKASPESFESLSEESVFDDGVCWTPPTPRGWSNLLSKQSGYPRLPRPSLRPIRKPISGFRSGELFSPDANTPAFLGCSFFLMPRYSDYGITAGVLFRLSF